MAPHVDQSSLSNPQEVVVSHLEWDVCVDFAASVLVADATYNVKRIRADAELLCLDTCNLEIHSVHVDGSKVSHKLKSGAHAHLGKKLVIPIGDSLDPNIRISYSTTKASSALQWLPPSQTAGKKYPYLFTQCQAVHARSLVPCQDQPGVKMTYSARVTVPAWATCVMSALHQSDSTENGQTTWAWNQPVALPSYLLALAVGDLKSVKISERCCIWSEPSVVEVAAYEFAQTEEFLTTAEAITGMRYPWGRYDLLCLPPSFPYGGMENPCLTFVTPTLLAGDRSLADVVAHEISHSWTGNLVTNATWEHFWLNEGWTMWLQRKIMTRVSKDEKLFDFDAIGGWKALQESVHLMPEDFTRLVPILGDQDPDDAFSSVPYEKGFNLLYYLERQVGRQQFETFFQEYIKEFAYKTVTSFEFRDFFQSKFPETEVNWEEWFHLPGMPIEVPNFDRSLAQAAENLASLWLAVDRHGRMLPTVDLKNWSTGQVTCFLDSIQSQTQEHPLTVDTITAMNVKYGMAASQNSEILFRYCQLAVAAGDEAILPVVVRFITTQGRMKFVRPLYRSLYQSKMGKSLAVDMFLQKKDFYHPICAKMIASDLKGSCNGRMKKMVLIVSAAAAGAAVAFVVLRRRR